MYPGYDIWWHLDVIRSIDYFDGQSYGRWHWIWNRLLEFFEVSDFFARALVIHRTQFVVSLLSLYASAILLMSAVLRGRLNDSSIFALLAFFSVVYWFLMHGTSSRAAYLGEDSAATMSWINWYSVSHQITMPLCILAISLMIRAMALSASESLVRLVMLMLAFFLVLLVALLHAAEVPYFLFMALVGVLLYVGRRRFIFVFVGSVFFVFLFAVVFSRLSHGESQLISSVAGGNFSEIWRVMQRYGHLMLAGLNRASTGWNLLYTFSLVLMVGVIGIWFIGRGGVNARSMLWIAASVLLPASIYFKYTAGLLAQITYLTLAWRFSFGSLLFVAPSIYFGAAIVRCRGISKSCLLLWVFFVPMVVLLMSAFFAGGVGAVRSNVSSLAASLDRGRMHFGISESQYSALSGLSRDIGVAGVRTGACFDLFTSYYLFYLFDSKGVCYPRRIKEGPTYMMSIGSPGSGGVIDGCGCSFSKSNMPVAFRSEQLAWDYRLLK